MLFLKLEHETVTCGRRELVLAGEEGPVAAVGEGALLVDVVLQQAELAHEPLLAHVVLEAHKHVTQPVEEGAHGGRVVVPQALGLLEAEAGGLRVLLEQQRAKVAVEDVLVLVDEPHDALQRGQLK